jgi:vancomycin permeability regulator SanA
VRPNTATQADVALIFGAVVRKQVISPLHQERLDAGITLLNTGTVQRLVVSNTPLAASAMQSYLLSKGVLATAIEMDTQAERTPDTCAFEARRAKPRRVILVSQRFHLPRLALQCREFALNPQYVMADSLTRAPSSIATKLRVRGMRFVRETTLIWGALLGLYPQTLRASASVKNP